jgi:hypothetical protein
MRDVSAGIRKVYPEFDLSRTIVDLDGVLCVDFFGSEPDEFDLNDPNDAWANHLKYALPLWIPELPVLGIITTRLQKYQEVTEQWLCAHGIQCHWMMMSKCETPAQRRAYDIGYWKAQAYLAAQTYPSTQPANLLVESDRDQARSIARFSGKPVYSMQEQALLVIRLSPSSVVIESPPELVQESIREPAPGVELLPAGPMTVGYVCDFGQWRVDAVEDGSLEMVEETDGAGELEDVPTGRFRSGEA